MKQRYTISVTGPVWVDYSIATDATCVSDAINHLESLDPEIAAQRLIESSAYSLERIEREVYGGVGNAVYDAIPNYVFNRAGEMKFGSEEEEGHDGVAGPAAQVLPPQRVLLTGTGLASRRYTFEAESWEDALSQFDRLSTEELNARTWSIWGIDLEANVSLVAAASVEEGEADEDALGNIAMHLDVQLPQMPSLYFGPATQV